MLLGVNKMRLRAWGAISVSGHSTRTLSTLVRRIPPAADGHIQHVQIEDKPYHGTYRRNHMSVLPWQTLLRTYLIMSISSSPSLLALSTAMVQKLLHARTAVFDVDRNHVLRWMLKQTFYKQFCAGETPAEVSQTVSQFHKQGSRVMLEYAKEVLQITGSYQTAAQIQADVGEWKQGVLQTIAMVAPGDMVALKWSGMGGEAFRLMTSGSPPSPYMKAALLEICDAAAMKGASLMPSAEPQNANGAVDEWNIMLAREYNTGGNLLIYNTYQAYLKSTPETLARHLHVAQRFGFALGVKLVRGAYLHSEPRHLIWDTKQETDVAYDGIAIAIIERHYNDVLRCSQPTHRLFPIVGLNLATHNRDSIRKVIELRREQVKEGEPPVELQYAQLQGMADDLNSEIVSGIAGQARQLESAPRVLKFVTWGSMKDCLHYLLRRAAENSDAMSRTVATRRTMGSEIRRRLSSFIVRKNEQ